MAFEPENSPGSCLVMNGNVLDVAACDLSDATQSFTFGGSAAAVSSSSNSSASAIASTTAVASQSTGVVAAAAPSTSIGSASRTIATVTPAESGACGTRRTVTSWTTVTASQPGLAENAGVPGTDSSTSISATSATAASPTAVAASSLALTSHTGAVTAIPDPTVPVPVSRGGTLVPSAAAEANPFDSTATRAFINVTIKAPNGQCMFVDPTAGDFRENLIPISLVDCAGTPNEKWDVVTAGAHNDQPQSALIVSSLVRITLLLVRTSVLRELLLTRSVMPR